MARFLTLVVLLVPFLAVSCVANTGWFDRAVYRKDEHPHPDAHAPWQDWTTGAVSTSTSVTTSTHKGFDPFCDLLADVSLVGFIVKHGDRQRCSNLFVVHFGFTDYYYSCAGDTFR
ncbi:hypothetical protein RBB50_004763 [Rhinocladiella similis]